MSFIEKLEELDRAILLAINGSHTQWLDVIMYQGTQRLIWVPLYLFIAYLMYRRYGWNVFKIIVFTVPLLILCADQTANLFKEGIERYRPCNNLEIKEMVHLVNGYCSSAYSFFSGHASNAFAIAIFTITMLRKNAYLVIGLLLWAAFGAYTRVYLGVHYPSDIVAGALVGGTYGYLFARLTKLAQRKFDLE